MEELLTQIIQAIVDKPDEVEVKAIETENQKIYELRVGDGDLGKVIGKRGKNIMAIRTWLEGDIPLAIKLLQWANPNFQVNKNNEKDESEYRAA